MTIIFFMRTLPNPITDELTRQGHQVFECLAISEVLALQEQNSEAQIVIDHTIEAERAKVIQTRFPTLQLRVDTSAADVVFELSQTKGATIQ